jgi:glycosyltransferase involved in cell wall biosynthesis
MKERIKVCFVMPKGYCLFDSSVGQVFGGSEVDLYFIATELAKDDDFEVIFVVADYGQEVEKQIEGVRVIKSLDLEGNPLAGAIKIWQAMKKAKADIYITKTPSYGVLLIVLFCKIYNKKFVYKTANERESSGAYISENGLLGKVFGWSLKKADKIIVQNQINKENLLESLKIDARVIRNGHRLLEGDKEHKRDIILWVGRSVSFKQPGRLVELAKRFENEKFVMICQRATGDDDYDSLKQAAREVGNLEFIERVGFAEIDDYFRRAKIFVNTSDSEGFPNTFIQAAKAGAAIVSYSVNPDDFLGEYNCGVDCMGDMEKVAKAVRFLLDEDKYREIGLNGRKYAEANHNIAVLIDEYKRIFREIVNKH